MIHYRICAIKNYWDDDKLASTEWLSIYLTKEDADKNYKENNSIIDSILKKMNYKRTSMTVTKE